MPRYLKHLYCIIFFFVFLSCWFCFGSWAANPTSGAQAVLSSPEGKKVGTVMFREKDDGLEILVSIEQLEPGEHALHIHEKADCKCADFTCAGGHFNPDQKQHGFLNPQGPHAGDLTNITIQEDGTAKMRLMTKRLTLKREQPHSLFRKGGTSVVIHQNPDDYITDPAGHGGERMACGAIEPLERKGRYLGEELKDMVVPVYSARLSS